MVSPQSTMPHDDLDSTDCGATSLVVIVLTGVTMVMMFAAVQAALWMHARAEARSVARDTAVLIARQGVSPADAAQQVIKAFNDTPDGDERDTGVSYLLSNPRVQIEPCDTTMPPANDDGSLAIEANCADPYDPNSVQYVKITITGVAPGIVRGTGVDVTVVEKVAVEGFRK